MCNLCIALLVQEKSTPQDDIDSNQWYYKSHKWCVVDGVQLGTKSSSIGLLHVELHQNLNANFGYR